MIIWLLFCLLIPVMEILLHTVEDHFNRRWVDCQQCNFFFIFVTSIISREMKEKLVASARKKQNLERMMTIGVKSIKVLPLEQDKSLTMGKVEEDDEVEAAKLTQWVLTYIEFIGNFVILAFLLTFISIYWCIGNWNIELM